MKAKINIWLAVNLLVLWATMSAWAADPTTVAAPGTARSTNIVTFQPTVNTKVGINVDSGVNIGFGIDNAITGWKAGVGSVIVRVFYNGSNAAHLKADNTGTDFPSNKNLTVSNIRVTAAGAGYSFPATSLTGNGIATLKDWAGGALNGWKAATHTYEYNVQGNEKGGGPYSASIVYTMTAD